MTVPWIERSALFLSLLLPFPAFKAFASLLPSFIRPIAFDQQHNKPSSWRLSPLPVVPTMSHKNIYYSDKYYDENYEYRWVVNCCCPWKWRLNGVRSLSSFVISCPLLLLLFHSLIHWFTNHYLLGTSFCPKKLRNWFPRHTWWRKVNGADLVFNSLMDGSITWFMNLNHTSSSSEDRFSFQKLQHRRNSLKQSKKCNPNNSSPESLFIITNTYA